MAKFNEYPAKTILEDEDALMLYDAATKSNKLSPFSGIWNWMVNKLTNAVINNLQTSNKTVVGALNELNSKANYNRLSYERTYGKTLSVQNVRTGTHGLILIEYNLIPFYISGSISAGYTIAIPQLPDGVSISNDIYTITIATKTDKLITCIYPVK